MNTLERLAQMQELQKSKLGFKDGQFPNELERGVYDDFENNPAYRVVKRNYEDDIRIHFIRKNRQYGDPEIYAIPYLEDQLEIGDYITDEHKQDWLCYSLDRYPIRKNFMYYCNNKLRWLVEDKIEEMSCVLNDKTSVYSDGLYKDRRIILADDQILITIPDGEIASTIHIGKRFIFNNNKNNIYKVVRIDRLPRPNLVDIKLRHDEYDRFRDNLELGLADYYVTDEDNNSDIPSTNNDYVINVDGYTKIAYGTLEPYIVKVIKNGIEVSEEVNFELIDAENKATIHRVLDNVCEIKATDKKKKDKFKLKISLKDNPEINTVIDLEIVLW